METILILAINPGSTSTKMAVYQATTPILVKTLKHTREDLGKYATVAHQFSFRKHAIMRELEIAGTRLDLIRVVMGRGGLLKPIQSGVYEVNDDMTRDLSQSINGEHACNLGGLIADEIARSLPNAKAYIADPVVVDEFEPLARVSGHPSFQRKSIFHALNQKAIARQHAKAIQRDYEGLNLLVCHLGGGISVGAHHHGKVVDVNNALDGEGAFSPERSGTLPVGDLVSLCFDGTHSKEQIQKMIAGEGGLVAFLGTNSTYDVDKRVAEGDEKARFYFDAMAYQVSKQIGSMAPVLYGEVDAILITGGIANSKYFVGKVVERVSKIAPVHVYPGEDEMFALAINGLMVISGEVIPRVYA